LWPKERGRILWEELQDLSTDLFLSAVKSYIADPSETKEGKIQSSIPPTVSQIKSRALQIQSEQEAAQLKKHTHQYERSILSFPDPESKTFTFQLGDVTQTLTCRVQPSHCALCGDGGWARFFILGTDWSEFYTLSEIEQWPQEMQDKAVMISTICQCDHPKAIYNRAHLHPRILRCADVLRTRKGKGAIAGG
jgi:hypothetical protein